MKDIEIKLNGGQNLGEIIVCLDNKPVNLKKNEFSNLVCKHQTENDSVTIKVYRMLDVGGALWFITQLFFFIISIFGIFDVHYKEKCFIVDFEAEVDLKEDNKIILQFNKPKKNEKAINMQTDLTSQEVSNVYYLDAKAKKTLIGLRITKILLTLAILAIAAVVLMNKFF